MPYTPPAQLSPAASRPESPVLSRNQSYVKFQHSNSLGSGQCSPSSPRPGLPRSMSSTSYLHKHRRSPSVQMASVMFQTQTNEPDTPEDTPMTQSINEKRSTTHSSSIRQSPPPVNDQSMPTGAVISPPDSGQNSSDDEELGKRGRVRSLEDFAALQAAIASIEQHREGSPDLFKEETRKARMALGLLVTDEKANAFDGTASPGPRFATETTRKTQHSRSATESSVPDLGRGGGGLESPERLSDSDLEEDSKFCKPPMLRKKSGELVRPALRPTYSKRRPSSMPGTPTYSKAVHFDSHLEHVRHFLQVDRPLAVSANSSPVETFDGEMEFPFGTAGRSREPAWQWDIKLPNFPSHSFIRSQQPVHVERVFLSSDSKTLIATVAVQNLSFNKLVVARFTLDHWKTTSEVTAEFNSDLRRMGHDNLDRFNFNIKLEDLANLENKTLFFCVRYNVNGQEYWDSNGNVNFQVNFMKKVTPQNGKQGLTINPSKPLGSLPRSRPSPPMSARQNRPKSVPSFDDFAHGFENEFTTFPPPGSNVHNDTPIRFRNRPTSEEPVAPRTKAPSQAFGNRYDFGASLSAALQAAQLPKLPSKEAPPGTAGMSKDPGNSTAGLQRNAEIQPFTTASDAKPSALNDKPALKSQSYNELLEKFCFFGSGKASPLPSKSENDLPATDGMADSKALDPPTVKEVSSAVTPSPEDAKASCSATPTISRSSSPMATGSRTTSPVSFGYPYHQPMQNGMFNESHTSTAILG